MQNNNHKIKTFVGSPFLWIIALLILILIFSLTSDWWPHGKPAASSRGYPLCANSNNVIRATAGVTKVKIKPKCWSVWIQIPPQKNFRVDTPGEVEVLFWNGKRYFFADNNPQWLGDIPSSTFRLRGKEGIAEIYVENAW